MLRDAARRRAGRCARAARLPVVRPQRLRIRHFRLHADRVRSTCRCDRSQETSWVKDGCQSIVDGELNCASAPVEGNTESAGNHLGNSASDHIFRLTVDHRTNVRLDTCGSNYDTYLRGVCSWPVAAHPPPSQPKTLHAETPLGLQCMTPRSPPRSSAAMTAVRAASSLCWTWSSTPGRILLCWRASAAARVTTTSR